MPSKAPEVELLPDADSNRLQQSLQTVLEERTVIKPEATSTKTSRPKSTLNLQELFKATPTSPEKKSAEPVAADEIKNPVHPEALQSAWAEFAELRKNQVAEYQLLRRDITFEPPVITVTLANPVEETLLENFKRELLQFLREKLKNTDLSIIPVQQTQQQQKVVYTSREKFEHLAAKNPLLHQLKERLGLDWDF